VSGDAVHQPTWPLLLKIEHMVKLQVLGNNSKTVNNIKKKENGKKKKMTYVKKFHYYTSRTASVV
jgi:hypothetical protein